MNTDTLRRRSVPTVQNVLFEERNTHDRNGGHGKREIEQEHD